MKTIVLAAVAVAVTAPAWAATPMVVSWPTWLRAGPSVDTKVIDEVPSGWRVDVQGCADGWCRVESDHAAGWLPQSLLASTLEPGLVTAGGADCFPATHQTPERAIAMRICPATVGSGTP